MAPATQTTATPQVQLADKPLEDRFLDALLSLEVHQSVHTAGRVTAMFEDPLLELFDAGGIDVGAKFSVKLPDAKDKLISVFSGRVTAIGVEHNADGDASPRARFVMEARDESHLLAVSAKFEAHEKTAKAVVEAIAKRHKLTPEIGTIPDVGGDPYIIQTGTDHAMLTELARRFGCEWFTNGQTLHFRPRPVIDEGAKVSRLERSLVHFSARYTGVRNPKSLNVMGWDPAKAAKTEVASPALSSTTADLGSSASFVAEQAKKAQTAFGQPLMVGELASVSVKENEAIAAGLAVELAGSGLFAEGVAHCNPQIRAGEYVTVDGFGKKLSGSYYVTDVVHAFGSGQALMTRFTCNGHAVEPPSWNPSGGRAGSWAGSGPVVAVVTNTKDPKKLGRVKVKFPSLGEIESTWARVVSMGAGADRGIDFRPEADDEVLVAFERGDPRFPLVLGGLWNGTSTLPKDVVAAGDMSKSRVIRSRSGHVLAFGDGAKDEAKGSKERFVSITTGDTKSKVVVNEKDGITLEVPDGNQITFKAGAATMTLTDKGDIEIKTAKGKFVVKASEVAVEGKTKLEVKGAAGALIDGGSKLEVKSSGTATVQAGGILTLKGSMVKIN
ncbi:MAG: phage protein D/phage baseplate assembly protein gpV [Glaciecola sp.]|jgi:phage protein D/phage baseplate assembly protein gpV